ncbi:MAG: helix-hairpin-helix domain-containing protein, partial [Candidatus Pacebacteria bacterium]|nr:helix-hairpin-helix domain-containing protein [Candidatus Paceibacterota bacterium]
MSDIARQINLLTQGFTELTEEQKQQPEEKTEKKEIEELKEKEADVCIVNINTASKEELQKLTNVGLVIAQRIIDARPFFSVYDLIRVSGIGEITLQRIIEQGCAYVEGDTGPSGDSNFDSGSGSGGDEGNSSSSSTQPQSQPQISLSYPEDNPVGKEIKVNLYTSNLKSSTFDVKISIEREGKVISDIFNDKEDKWSSSFYYLKEVFSGTSLSK